MWISFNLLIVEIDIDATVIFDLVAKTYSSNLQESSQSNPTSEDEALFSWGKLVCK